ncbi:MAG: biopolymer transporter ExbD [Planctomycetota bacterium]|nr:biopolymer transporter ExbD [Planctomycetota bacterium]
MNFARSTGRGHGHTPRLPLVAIIDVVLFLLLYFCYVADLTPEERHLASAIQADTSPGGASGGLVPQVLIVESAGGRVRYRMGERVMESREALGAVLRSLPTSAGIVIRVNADVPVGAAAAAVAAGREAGFTKISYVPGS